MSLTPLDLDGPLLAERRRMLAAGEEVPINRAVFYLRCPGCGYAGPENAFAAFPDQAFTWAGEIAAFLEVTLSENPRRKCPDCGKFAELEGVRLHLCAPSLRREVVIERAGEITVVHLVAARGVVETVTIDDHRVEEACLDSCLRAGNLIGEMGEGQLERALTLVRRVVAARPADPKARLTSARLLLRMERPRDAAEQLLAVDDGLRKTPQLSLEGGALLGEAAIDLDDELLVERALTLCREVLGAEDEAPAAHLALGRLLLERERLDEARTHLEAAARDSDQAFSAAFHLAILAGQEDRHADAIALYDQLLRVQPYHVDVRRALTWSLIEHGQLARAEEQIAQTEKLDPRHPENAALRSRLEERRREP